MKVNSGGRSNLLYCKAVGEYLQEVSLRMSNWGRFSITHPPPGENASPRYISGYSRQRKLREVMFVGVFLGL